MPGSCSFISASASRIASAARTALSGSSSCVVGAPNTAITASPMNFSTVPPRRSSSSRSRAKYGVRVARTSSGSSCSLLLVKPTRSANRTVMTFRSSRVDAASSASGDPQFAQKPASSGFRFPQVEQVRTAGAYPASPPPEVASSSAYAARTFRYRRAIHQTPMATTTAAIAHAIGWRTSSTVVHRSPST